MSRAAITPTTDATKPAAAKANTMATFLPKPPSREAAKTNAAESEATWESNRSAPIPATSPTLSPTLSAITAGLRGSSSGMSSSTFPTRSAAMSAVFVKMPPPALANNAKDEAPRLKPSVIVGSLVRKVTPVTPSKLAPTTAMPITAPPRKPVKKAGTLPLVAASAVRVLAIVATAMPT